MTSRTTRVGILVGAAVAAAFVAAVAIRAFNDGGGTATKAEYQATIQNARDRIDYAYGRIASSTSVAQVADRLDEASVAIDATAGDLDKASVAPGFEALNSQLVDTLHQFSVELANTAAQFRDPSFGDALSGINSLGFTQWDDVNTILTKMKKKGLEVELLQRH